ncbi:hypothetical protein VU03_00530, partial [Desulfobulbus sp. N3]|nr:hypothetical protein [Desulfobulbus sp. N3]
LFFLLIEIPCEFGELTFNDLFVRKIPAQPDKQEKSWDCEKDIFIFHCLCGELPEMSGVRRKRGQTPVFARRVTAQVRHGDLTLRSCA